MVVSYAEAKCVVVGTRVFASPQNGAASAYAFAFDETSDRRVSSMLPLAVIRHCA